MQSPAETATGLGQTIASKLRQRLATTDAFSPNSVNTSSPGLQNFWKRINIQNLVVNASGNLSPTPPSVILSAAVEIHRSSTQSDPIIVSPDNGINRKSTVAAMTPSVGSHPSATRPRTLDGTGLSDNPISGSFLRDEPPDVATSSFMLGKASSVEHGRSATNPSLVGLAVNNPTATTGSPKVEVEPPLFALTSGVVDGFSSPLEMNDADFSVFTSVDDDLHPKRYEDGYHRSSFVSTVTDEDKVDVGVLRAISASGGATSPFIDPEKEKERLKWEAAALEAFRVPENDLRAAFVQPPELVDSYTPAVKPPAPVARSTVPITTVGHQVSSIAPGVTGDLNTLVTTLLQQNIALQAENSALKAAKSDPKVASEVVVTAADDDDEDVVEEFSGSNEYDMKDPWIADSPASASRSGGGTQAGAANSAPPRLVHGNHGPASMEGRSGLKHGTWMDNLTETGASQLNAQGSNEYSWFPTQGSDSGHGTMPSTVLHAGPTSPSPPGGGGGRDALEPGRHGPHPPKDSSHILRVNDVLLTEFVADNEVPADEPHPEYSDDTDLAVVIKKSDRLKPDQFGYGDQNKYLTKALPTQFGVLAVNVTEKSEKGNISQTTTIVEQFDTQLALVKNSQDHLHARDLIGLTFVPKKKPHVDSNMTTSKVRAANRHQLFVDGGSARVSILEDWSDVKWDDVVLWQRMVHLRHKSLSAYECGSNRILYTMLKKSCTSDFWDDILRQKEDSGLNEESWGGITFLYLCITTLFYAPEHVLVALCKDFKEFEKVGLTKTEGENVKVVTKHLGRLNMALRQGNGLQPELINMILQGMTVSSCVGFRDHFVQLQRQELTKLIQARRNRTRNVVSSQVELYGAVKDILSVATEVYEAHVYHDRYIDVYGNHLSFLKVTKSVPRLMTEGMACDNCLSTDHLSPDCPEEKNLEVMKANRAKRLEKEMAESADKDDDISSENTTEDPTVLNQAPIDAHRGTPAPAPTACAPAASAPIAATPISSRTLTAAQFSAYTARQSQLVDAITRHGPSSALGAAAQTQLSQLQKDLEAYFQ